MKEGPFGEDVVNGLESSLLSSSLSFGEKAAPNGLWVSSGEVVFGLAGLPLRLDWDGGVDPDENLELRLVIQEFLRPPTGLGALFCEAEDAVVGAACLGSPLLSLGFSSCCPFSPPWPSSDVPFSASRRGSGLPEDDGGRAGLLFDRIRRCDAGGAVVESLLTVGRSLTVDVNDFVRER